MISTCAREKTIFFCQRLYKGGQGAKVKFYTRIIKETNVGIKLKHLPIWS